MRVSGGALNRRSLKEWARQGGCSVFLSLQKVLLGSTDLLVIIQLKTVCKMSCLVSADRLALRERVHNWQGTLTTAVAMGKEVELAVGGCTEPFVRVQTGDDSEL